MTVRFCTSVHYWRTPVSRWEHVLDRLSAAGMQGIDVYVPWAVHEREPGRCDFGDDPQLDLPRFLRLVRQRGMWVLLRPGPQVNAELNNFGLPDRIVEEDQIQALGPRGRPVFCVSPPVFFPVPSYASERYHEEVASWFHSLGEVLAPVIGEASSIRMVQVDNETSLFFREAPFDQDYHPEALSLWQDWQRDHGLAPEDAPLRRMPGPEGLRIMLAWVRFRRFMMIRCLGIFKDLLKDAGLGVAPFSHNMPPSGLWQPLRPGQLGQAVDVAATDIYSTADRIEGLRDQILQLRSVTDEPFAAELGCGTVYFAPAISAFDNRFVASASLAYGLKGFNLYMGGGRDRWIGGLIPESGEREAADLLHFFQRLIRLMGTVGLRHLEPVARAVIIVPECYMDHSLASFPIPGMSAALMAALDLPVHETLVADTWDMGRPVQSEWIELVREYESMLAAVSLPHVMASGEEPLDPSCLVLAPTFRYLTTSVVQNLLAHVEAGGRVIACPQDPELDDRLEPLDRELARRWQAARDGGDLVVAASLEDPAVKPLVVEAGRALAGDVPWEVGILSPLARILPHRGPGGEQWVSWIVCSGSAPGTRLELQARKGWSWIQRLSVRERASGGEFIQERGRGGRKLRLTIEGCEVHLVEWRKGDVE